jgi:acyl-CoA reductase-like NAD-dependent aldehyde dehydrogenase
MVQGVIVEHGCLINTNPATGVIISRVPCSTPEEVEGMVHASAIAQIEWSQTPLEDRIDFLRQGLNAIAKISDSLVDLIVTEMGKPLAEAKEELQWAVGKDHFMDLLLESLQPQTHGKCTIVRDPFGVVAIMSPWNFPVDEILLLALPSLASGNTVIVKPSEVVPESGALLVKTLQSVLPQNVIQVAQGDGTVGKQLVSHPDVQMVAMTGSTLTGQKILQAAAPQMKRVVLEMGGKDPVIVFEDADIEKAAKDAVYYSLFNAGQVCCSFERIYVAESIYDKFQVAAQKYAAEYKVGSGMDPDVRVGPLVSSIQRDEVKMQVEDAVAKGAKLLHQSSIPDNSQGSFYPVTVLADVTDEMIVFSKETFGPVISMTSFDGSEAEGVRLANNSEYGLASSVYSEDLDKARRVASRISAGQVGINCYSLANMDVHCPWVGHKASGFGFHSGTDGFHQFSVPKSIIFD